MKLLDTVTFIGEKLKALIAKDAELEGKITALESKGIDKSTIDNLKAEIKTEVKADIIDNAPTTFDTLKEIAEYIETDKTTGAALATAVSNRVRYDEAQTLTTPQKKQALANIGADDMTVDFLAKLKEAMA